MQVTIITLSNLPKITLELAYMAYTDFSYEKGYEYIIEGLCIDYVVEGDMIFRTFQCCKILSKQKKQSENLPQ